MYYLSRFFSLDRFALLAKETTTILVSGMERGRAALESSAGQVESTSDYGIMEKLKEFGKPEEAYLAVLVEFLQAHHIRRLGMPRSAPAGVYRELSQRLSVVLVDSPFRHSRAVKSPDEVRAIESVQRHCEEAMDAAVGLIARSTPRQGRLYVDGKPLTSERVRSAIEVRLLEGGCEALGTIVCGAPANANPHDQGTGPLPADAPIVIDIFPRSKTSRYFADMTRTVLRGEASPEILDLYQAVEEAQQIGLEAVKAGVPGWEVHALVCDAFRERGYPEQEDRGYIHSTGHGVGLEVHELPHLGQGGEELQAGNVVTVEPGLYYPELGGVRLEDLVLVDAGGRRNLTRYERRLVLK
ncbi:MAG: aminopeptidase P family protein [Methanosarcinales archaeon]|nr:aminopeptidase P family protein [Methanosarcinales archaeon]